MATKTAEKKKPDHHEGGHVATKGKTLTVWQDFEGELKTREGEIASMLPGHVSRVRFMNSAIAAVKQNPALLTATPRSLFSAITKSAQDGILPDGREGVITVYNTKVKDKWETQAQWNPMTYGLRKRARELDQIIIDAQAVYRNDHFVWHQGDEPRIEHEPAALGQPRGDKIGAYAIFKAGDGTILHREVMDKDQIETARKQSKAPDSLMWTKFSEEGYRKVVVRRGIKSVPVSEKLAEIVRRDDDQYDFEPKPGTDIVVPPRPRRDDNPFDEGGTSEIIDQEATETNQTTKTETEPQQKEHPLQRGRRLLDLCKTTTDVADLRASVADELTEDAHKTAWGVDCDTRAKEIMTPSGNGK